jgi:hypothetical protein
MQNCASKPRAVPTAWVEEYSHDEDMLFNTLVIKCIVLRSTDPASIACELYFSVCFLASWRRLTIDRTAAEFWKQNQNESKCRKRGTQE